MTTPDALIQLIFFNNPDGYPPIINSVKLLVKAGWKVEIICREDASRTGGVEYPEGVCIHRIQIPRIYRQAGFLYFAQQVLVRAKRHATVVIGHDMHGLVAGKLLSIKQRCPLLYHCHDFAEDGRWLPFGSALVRWGERRIAKGTAAVIVPDKDRGAIVRQQLTLPHAPLTIANSPLLGTVPRDLALRTRLHSAGYDFEKIVLRQGSIGPGHAIESTIRSIKLWANCSWGFVAMGRAEAAYVLHLKTLAAELGVEGQFAYLPAVPYGQVSRYTFDADVGHALYEPLHVNFIHITTASNKLMEYLQAGLPVLVSDRPALAKFVSDYQCGLPADESSPASIANAINTLLGNSRQADTMAKCSRQCFVEHLCYERQFAPLLATLDNYRRGIAFSVR